MPSAATSLEWQGRTVLARVGGSLTGFEDNGQSVQGRGDLVGWFSPAGRRNPIRLELSGGLGGSRHTSGFESFVGQGEARFHVQGRNAGVWGGVGGGLSKNSFDLEPVSSIIPEVGGWLNFGSARVIARYVDTRIEGTRFPEATISTVHRSGPVDVTAFVGVRDSPFEGSDADTWLGGSVALWVQSQFALLVSGGRYAPDILQGLPGGEFLSVGVRLALQRRAPVVPATPLPLMFTVESARSGEAGFSIEGAQTVEIAGDWNAWQPMPLVRSREGRWLLPTDLPVGVFRFNLLVNGERWIVPEGLPTVDDGFGGKVGLLVISAQ